MFTFCRETSISPGYDGMSGKAPVGGFNIYLRRDILMRAGAVRGRQDTILQPLVSPIITGRAP